MGRKVQSRRATISFIGLLGLGSGGLLSLLYLGHSLLNAFPKAFLMAANCPLVLAVVKGHLSANPTLIFPWIGFGLLLAGSVHALLRAGRTFLHVKEIKRKLFLIPAEACSRLHRIREKLGLEFEVYRFQGDLVETVFTMCFWRPKVYISTGLCQRLSDGELEGVILHEAHHVRRKDPLRQFLASFVRDFLFFLPLGGILKDIFAEAKEKAADDAAVEGFTHPLDLVSALLKLAAGPEAFGLPAMARLTDQSVLTVQRIERLLGLRGDEWPRIPSMRIFGSGAMVYLLYLCL